jgi:competence ComEA-like helix-hairpin-helix protein
MFLQKLFKFKLLNRRFLFAGRDARLNISRGYQGTTKLFLKIHRICLMLIFLFSCAAPVLQGQVKDSTRSEVQRDIEEALERFDPDDPSPDTEQLVQILQDLAANPVNINRATADNLLLVPGLNLRLVRAIVEYRDEVKPFENIEELREVSGIGAATLKRVRPYVTAGSGMQLRTQLFGHSGYWTSGGRFETFSRYQRTLQDQAGYSKPDSSGGYLGNPAKYYQRFKYRSDHFSVNLTQQKDAGEPLAGTTGFDYNSWHLALKDNGRLRDLVIGDYALYFGQGLVLWNGRTFGKGREVIGTANRSSRGVRAYSSSQESDFYRGAAATYGGDLQLTGFYSYRKQSASIIAADTSRMPQQDGYHRTQNERGQRRNLGQKTYGGRLQMELPFGYVGASGYRTSFDKFVSGGNRISDRFDFSGRATSAVGVDYTVLAGPAIIFGESARSENGGLGFLSGVEGTVGENTELTVAYRNYAKDFQSVMGNGFGESSGEPKNEEGFYLGLRHELNDNITLSAYFDQFNSPAPRFGTTQPTKGYDWLGLAEVEINQDLDFYMQARSEIEDDEYEAIDESGREQRRLGKAERSSLRAHLEYLVNPKIRLRSRAEVVRSRKPAEEAEYGYLMYQDLRFTPSDKWTIDTRVTIFDTESFDSRLYQFENDLLYVLSNQLLFNQGQRMYLLLNYEPLSYLEVWAKIGITIFENEQTISSGLNEIQGNKRSDVGIQLRLLL